MNITFYYSEIETIKKIIQYIDDRFNSGEHGDSYWVDHCGERTTVDTGYAFEWWEHCMKPELDDWIEHLDCMGKGLMTNHEVACILAELFGDDCACNFNNISEWLPKYCDFAETCCPDPVGVACWEQFLTHYNERLKNETD